jgi:hypothetical protein
MSNEKRFGVYATFYAQAVANGSYHEEQLRKKMAGVRELENSLLLENSWSTDVIPGVMGEFLRTVLNILAPCMRGNGYRRFGLRGPPL